MKTIFLHVGIFNGSFTCQRYGLHPENEGLTLRIRTGRRDEIDVLNRCELHRSHCAWLLSGLPSDLTVIGDVFISLDGGKRLDLLGFVHIFGCVLRMVLFKRVGMEISMSVPLVYDRKSSFVGILSSTDTTRYHGSETIVYEVLTVRTSAHAFESRSRLPCSHLRRRASVTGPTPHPAPGFLDQILGICGVTRVPAMVHEFQVRHGAWRIRRCLQSV